MTGAELKRWRKELALTQAEAAKELDVTRATIQNWEHEITNIPSTANLACRQIMLLWKRRYDYGPITLVYMTSKPPAGDLDPDRRTVLFCKRYSNNKSALGDLQLLCANVDFQNPLIIDDTRSVIWSGASLLEASEELSNQSN